MSRVGKGRPRVSRKLLSAIIEAASIAEEWGDEYPYMEDSVADIVAAGEWAQETVLWLDAEARKRDAQDAARSATGRRQRGIGHLPTAK